MRGGPWQSAGRKARTMLILPCPVKLSRPSQNGCLTGLHIEHNLLVT